ncbi:MAG: UDP-N-acetylmuramoyl-L-alanine--D-glutamate ligase [Burkholderiaceae bacterium]|jgi:UDP-N-acetylmuramoylalanine--D-glutamate ligase|nr:UDP-N-acetylmuramoyl-L-alanine--D-glutamate ligase [Burkholderiaceae bacterium]MEB2320631.1 UDP-N-acetylmuramoyl-L-alanine--D-glutamate ligase [Pseudomonadota bacterium]
MTEAAATQLPLFDLRGRRVLVLGLGGSGAAMARWALRQGAIVRIADSRTEPPGLASLRASGIDLPVERTDFDAGLLDGADLIAWSPGLSIETGATGALHAQARQRELPVVGELEVFSQAICSLPGDAGPPRVLAVTGTNGKTTVTAMATALCRAAGRSAKSAGNIGPSLLDALMASIDADDLPAIWVVELSSFQLALAQRFTVDAACILNVAEDHLDWHSSFESYADAKHRIHAPGCVAIYNRADPRTAPRRELPAVSFGPDAPARIGDLGIVEDGGMPWLAEGVAADDAPVRRRGAAPEVRVRRLMPADALLLRGTHNHQNALAALALCRAIGVPMAQMLHGLRHYRGEPHRCQLLGVLDGVEYYDDSKGTNVAATVAAIEGIRRPCWLIAGGDGKGQDFSPLADAVRHGARGVVLIGRDAERIAEALAGTGVDILRAAGLDEAVSLATERARRGEAVLLSPACSSLDMFSGYPERGRAFGAALARIADERGQPLEAPC